MCCGAGTYGNEGWGEPEYPFMGEFPEGNSIPAARKEAMSGFSVDAVAGVEEMVGWEMGIKGDCGGSGGIDDGTGAAC